MDHPDQFAENLYTEGKKHNWRQSKAPEAASLARACFERAAAMGHSRAIRDLAHMVYEGNGGERREERAFCLLWFAAVRDLEALGELADMLESFGEKSEQSAQARLTDLANEINQLRERLSRVGETIEDLARKARHGNA